MKTYICGLLSVAATIFMSCAFGFEKYFLEKKAVLEKPAVAVFVVKIGGPISCGAHQLLTHEFNEEANISCMNGKVQKKIEGFNALNHKEVFLVLSSIKGVYANGDILKAHNQSGLALEYGKKYLILMDHKKGQPSFRRCTIFDSSFYEGLLKANQGNLGLEELSSYVMKNHSLCKYE